MSAKNKREEILEVVKQYTNNNFFDISGFRKDHPKLYASLPYYFGGINGLLDELGLIKVQKAGNKTTRDRLAYDMLTELRKTNTLEQIAKKYNVSRALINQLYQSLDISIKTEDIKNNINI